MKAKLLKMKFTAMLLTVTVLLNFCTPQLLSAVGFCGMTAYAENISATVNTDRLNVRSGPGTSYSKVATLGAGTAVTVTSETNGSDGYVWYAISYGSGSGYARYDYISKNVTYGVQSADFESYMNQQGFPESYKNALRGLHQKYPNWVFVAQNTGLDWNTVVSEESKIGRSLVDKSSISSWKSLQTGAFDWAGNYWPGFDGATWVQASTELIAYYLDPRNFLTDPYVFQFEIQKYDPSVQTKDGLNSLIQGTFLAGEAVVPVEGSVIEGGTVIEGSTYNGAASSQSAYSAAGPSAGAASGLVSVIGPGAGTGANVIIGKGIASGDISTDTQETATGPYKISAVFDKLTGTITAYAGTWKHDGEAGNYTWYYADDNGQNLTNGWNWLDGNNDGIAECYYFYSDGKMAASTVVDGYEVNADGKWVGSDGTIQTKNVSAGDTSGTAAGQLKKVPYADIIMCAAEKSGVSPYVIASTIIQEQGNGKSDLVSGNNTSYPGYYNFFNTGAYEHDGMTAVTAGLKYAKEKGWDSIEKSIIGGAVNYGTNYVSQGQDTYYLKKFNVQGSNKFTHQYMTHILAAASEGAKVSNAYSSDFKQTALKFKIPVYSNMPENTALPTGDGNPNNKLSLLSVDGYTITPTFSMDTTEYSLIVEGGASSVNINATTIDSNASVTGAGSTALNAGLNTISIKVTAQNGSERTYTLSITRRDDGQSGQSSTQTESTAQPVGPGNSAGASETSGTAVIISGGQSAETGGSSVITIGQGPQ